ncbi:sensory box histidine kinase/response regulator [Richelia intracellularis]|nr:sensory box histidine kinase/response regulator [Richelia intracellularis]
MIGTHADICNRKQTEGQLQHLIAGTANTTGQQFFVALVRHIAEALNVSYVLVSKVIGNRGQSLSFWCNGKLQPNIVYDLPLTPCEYVSQIGEYSCEKSVQEKFPDDTDLVSMDAESYLGMALYNTQNKMIGHLCILDTKPLNDLKDTKAILEAFAATLLLN